MREENKEQLKKKADLDRQILNIDFEKVYRGWLGFNSQVLELDKFFIMGHYRSGTTWTHRLLSAHPQICVSGEGHFHGVAGVINEAFEKLNANKERFGVKNYVKDVDLLLLTRVFIDNKLASYIHVSGKKIEQLKAVADKTPGHIQFIAPLKMLYPKARFIHLVRDPRDVAVSAWFLNNHYNVNRFDDFDTHVEDAITCSWAANIYMAEEAKKNFPENFFQIRYEDLLENEKENLKKMLDFLEMDYSEEILSACLEAGSFKNASGGREKGQSDIHNTTRKGIKGDWKNHIKPELARKCMEHKDVKPWAEKFGYLD